MRLVTLLSGVAAAPVAEAVVRDGGVAVEAAGNPMTPWLALAFVAMLATLFGAHWLVTRRPRR